MLYALGQREAEGGDRSAWGDRRGSVRHRWPRVLACCAVAERTDASWLTGVRDLSAFGMGLLLPRKLEAGTLLEVELKSLITGQERLLLGRVMHAWPTPVGDWKLGCAFTGELSDDDLRRFQAARVRAAAGHLRRWVRQRCNVETVGTLEEALSGQRVPMRVVNVSPGGVALVTPSLFVPGTPLLLDLPACPPDLPKAIPVRIVRVRESAGRWFLGCEVADRLSDAELEALR
jgi:hypothetical protein